MTSSDVPTVSSPKYRGNSGLWFLGTLFLIFLISGSAFASRPDPWQGLKENVQPPQEMDLLLLPTPVPVDYREPQESEKGPLFYDALDILISGPAESQVA